MQLKKCLWCGEEFKAYKETAKYCCKKCSSKAMERKDTIICPTCKKTITVRRGQKFCSKLCADIASRGVRHKPVVYRICPGCGIQFEVKENNNKYCTRECRYKNFTITHPHEYSMEERRQSGERLRKCWKDPQFRNRMIGRMHNNNPMMDPDVVAKGVATRRQNNSYKNNFIYGNGRMSNYEQLVYDKIKSLGFLYNYPISTKAAKQHFPEHKYPNCYKPDFVHLDKHICLEVDGNNHNSEAAKQLDHKKNTCLKFLGYSVFRFSHKDIDDGRFDEWLDSYLKNI